MADRPRPFTDWVLLAGFCGFLFFFGLSYFGLVGADEPRYAQIAREMLARHDWVTPVLGGQAWLEKPPLYYWQAMIAYSVFGVSDWAARLPGAVDATALVVAVYLFLRRLRPGFELDGALMTASAAGVIGFARAASTDMPLAAALTVALLGWYAWYEGGRKADLAVFYVSLGLGALAKGPVAVLLAGAILGAFALVKRDLRLLWKTLWAPGIVSFLVVASPWFVLIQKREPEFFRTFFVEHNLARFGTNVYHHPGPFWYYVPVVLLGLLPWAVFGLFALVDSARSWWKSGREFVDSSRALDIFLMLWLALPVLFFSISSSKLPGYILPALPAGTLLLAEYVRRHLADRDRPHPLLVVVHSLVAALPVVPAALVSYLVLERRLPWGRPLIVLSVLALVLAMAIAVTLRSRLGLRAIRFVTLVPVVLVVAAVLRIGAPALDERYSTRPIALEIKRMEGGLLPLAVLRVSREVEYGLHFYRDQPVLRYELNEIPEGEHVLLAPEGLRDRVEKRTAGRRVSFLGSFPPQSLEFYWVGPVGSLPAHTH